MKIKKALASLSLMALFAGLLAVSCGSSPKAVLTEGLKVEGTAGQSNFKDLASDKTVSVIIELSDDEVKDDEEKNAIGWIKAKVGDATAATALDASSGISVTAKPSKSKPTDAKYDRITLTFKAVANLVKLIDENPTITIPASVLKSGKDLTVTTTGNKKLTFAIVAAQAPQQGGNS